jgi:hypothetical protein
MKIINMTFDNMEGGIYQMCIRENNFLRMLELEMFSGLIIDAKTLDGKIHKDEIIKILNLDPLNKDRQ